MLLPRRNAQRFQQVCLRQVTFDSLTLPVAMHIACMKSAFLKIYHFYIIFVLNSKQHLAQLNILCLPLLTVQTSSFFHNIFFNLRSWFRNVPRKISEVSPIGYIHAGKRPRGWPKPRWWDYNSYLAWSFPGVEPVELLQVAENREVFRNLGLLNR